MGLLDRLQAATRARPAWLRTAANLLGHRRRRCWTDGRRAHIELRALDAAQFERFAAAALATFDGLGGVASVKLNGCVGRAIVEYDPVHWSLDALAAVFSAIELRLGLHDLPFADALPDHPADAEPLLRRAVDLTADGIGVALGSMLRAVGYQPSRAGFDFAALMTIVENTPRLRQLLVDRVGGATTEVVVGVSNAFVQAVGAGPLGPLVDMLVQAIKLRAERARRAAWVRREPELYDDAHAPVCVPPPPPYSRPRPLPDSVVERYADDALLASLGGFLVGIADTHRIEAAVVPLFSGLPRAALYGRTIFAAELARTLADRGALVLRPDALGLLDRVDTLLVDADVLLADEQIVAGIVPAPGVERAAATAQAERLFDGTACTCEHVSGDWRLAPAEPGPRPRRLTLYRGDAAAATVLLRPALRRGTDALLAGVRRARLHLVVATDDPALALALAAHARVGADALLSTIAEQQREGHVVALLAADGPAALAAADLGLGLTLDPRRAPWAADVVLGGELELAGFVVDAIGVARKVAEQSVVLAGVGAALGAALALGGLKQTRPHQVMLATHAASVIALANGLRQAVALARRPPPAQADPTPWHRLTVDEALARQGSGADGLSDATAASRRRPETRPPSVPLRLARAVAAELVNPLTPVLITGAALSAVTGSFVDAALIAGVFALNGALGGFERFQAEGAIAALSRRERPAVRVLRDGRWRDVAADELVPGDIVEVEAGEVVAGDCRVLLAESLELDESSLTGESLPVGKDPAPSYATAIAERGSMLYEGTAVAAGRGRGLVVAVGPDTEARRGLHIVQDMSQETGVEARLRHLTEAILPVAGLSGVLLIGAGLFRHQDVHQLVELGVSMTVAAVPEGLPLLATVAQLAAARRLSQRGALVRNPRTIEALGRLDVLCVDKTGTLTEGQIRLHGLADAERTATVDDGPLPGWARELLAAGLRASPPAPERGALPHPTDRAVVEGARAAAVDPSEGLGAWERLHDLPFEPGRGYHGVLGRSDDGLRISVKGAPEVVLPRCSRVDGRPLDGAARARLLARADALAAEGLRVLAIAERAASETRDLDDARIGRLQFRGFVGLSDPPRASAAGAVERLQAAGIDLMMITGDHPRTARRIADELGLLGGLAVLSGPELDVMSDEEVDDALPGVGVVARATPSHKVRIVKALQRAGRVVGMTGDGANDASAIRLADVGIALGEGSTVAARDAADLIVVDERIDTIVDAIAEGRAMWSSVRDAVAILSGGNLGEIGFSVAAGFLGGMPLAPRQLLLVNLLTDVAPAMAIALRPPPPESLRNLLSEGPEAALGAALDREIEIRAATTAGGAGLAWLVAHALPGGRRGASTVALLALVCSQLGQTLVSGPPTREVWGASLGSLALLLGIVETPGVSHLFGCRPLGPVGLGVALGSAALATGASVVVPPALTYARERWAARRSAEPPEIDVEIRLGHPHVEPAAPGGHKLSEKSA
jgi:cation-transporting ATPase I